MGMVSLSIFIIVVFLFGNLQAAYISHLVFGTTEKRRISQRSHFILFIVYISLVLVDIIAFSLFSYSIFRVMTTQDFLMPTYRAPLAISTGLFGLRVVGLSLLIVQLTNIKFRTPSKTPRIPVAPQNTGAPITQTADGRSTQMATTVQENTSLARY